MAKGSRIGRVPKLGVEDKVVEIDEVWSSQGKEMGDKGTRQFKVDRRVIKDSTISHPMSIVSHSMNQMFLD